MIKYNINTCDQVCNELMVHFTKACENKCAFCVDALNKGIKPQRPNVDEMFNSIKSHEHDITSVPISGGEPLDQFYPLLTFLELVRSHTKKRVWLYTGNTVDVESKVYQTLANFVDVIVEGEFVEELKDSTLQFRGSSNQRIIDLPASIENQQILLWEDKKYEV